MEFIEGETLSAKIHRDQTNLLIAGIWGYTQTRLRTTLSALAVNSPCPRGTQITKTLMTDYNGFEM